MELRKYQQKAIDKLNEFQEELVKSGTYKVADKYEIVFAPDTIKSLLTLTAPFAVNLPFTLVVPNATSVETRVMVLK